MSDVLTYNGSHILDYEVWDMPHTIPTVNVVAIIDSALNVAEVDGFVNPVAMEAMLWLHLAATIMPELNDELTKIAETDGVFAAIDKIQADGIIAKLHEEHADDVAFVFNLADVWYRQYTKFLPSFAGQIGRLSFLTEDSVKDAIEGIQKVLASGDVEKINRIAEAWGMNNELPQEQPAE